MASKTAKTKGKVPAKSPPAKAKGPTQLTLLDGEKAARRARTAEKSASAKVAPRAPLPSEAPSQQLLDVVPEAVAEPKAPALARREISISEFFTKNRHLLGFDSPSKALLTAVKEAVDNSLDACEEAGILPEVLVEVREVGPDRYTMAVEDNGPGIMKAQIPKIFGKLLYGSKFHRLKQSRGQQGIGISAAAMYGQLTTGKSIVVTSKTGKGRKAHHFEIQIDTRKNQPVVARDDELDWERDHGTRVEIEMEADYRNGKRWLARYLEQTALANPHCRLEYRRPDEQPLVFPRAAEEPPREALEIKPHPHGVELGQLIMKLQDTHARDVRGCLMHEFSRVSPSVALEILKKAGIAPGERAKSVANHLEKAQKLHKAIQATKIMSPPTNCLSPIGEELIHKGLMNFLAVTQEIAQQEELEQLELQATTSRGKRKQDAQKRLEELAKRGQEAASEPQQPKEEGEEIVAGHKFFITSVTRPPKVYRGNPFQVEVGLAYGGPLPQDRPIELYRFANRVPLLFQRGACGVTEAVVRTDWRNYELSQPRGSLPVGPMILFVHIASVWVPFTSESKEAVAHYPEILGEIKLAAQECGRRLAAFVRKRKGAEYELQRRSIFELYIEEIAQSIQGLVGVSPDTVKREFGKLARRFTGGELTDAILNRASEKVSKRPRTAEAEA